MNYCKKHDRRYAENFCGACDTDGLPTQPAVVPAESVDSVALNLDAQLRAVVKERDDLRAAFASRNPEVAKPTDISQRLREYASNPGYSHSDYADTMRAAAEEIERYYGGMLAWKKTAEAKDAAPSIPAQAAPITEAKLRRIIDSAWYSLRFSSPSSGIMSYTEAEREMVARAILDAARTAIPAQAGVPDGYALVPIEPTMEMLNRGHHQIDFDRGDQNTEQLNHPSQTEPDGAGTSVEQDMRDAWAAMLAAAPSAPIEGVAP